MHFSLPALVCMFLCGCGKVTYHFVAYLFSQKYVMNIFHIIKCSSQT